MVSIVVSTDWSVLGQRIISHCIWCSVSSTEMKFLYSHMIGPMWECCTPSMLTPCPPGFSEGGVKEHMCERFMKDCTDSHNSSRLQFDFEGPLIDTWGLSNNFLSLG